MSYLSCELLAGKRSVRITAQRTKRVWACFIRELVDLQYSTAEKIVLVLDNLNTHTPAALYEAFPLAEARRLVEKLEIHSTLKHGSWREHRRDRTRGARRRLLEPTQ